jgi:hypothetical protein
MLANQEGQPRDIAQIRRAKHETTVSSLEGQSKDVGNAKSHPTSLANLCPVNINDGGSSINIVCCWSAIIGSENAADSIVHGQHHLRSLIVRPIKSKGCPLSLTAKFKPNFSHNFDEGPLVSQLSEWNANIAMNFTLRPLPKSSPTFLHIVDNQFRDNHS